MKTSLFEYTIILVLVGVIVVATVVGLTYLFSYVIMYVWNYFAIKINPEFTINQWVAFGILLIISWIIRQFNNSK